MSPQPKPIIPRPTTTKAYLRQRKHVLYMHIDPGTRELLYVGISCNDERPRAFLSRRQDHMVRLRELVRQGWTKDQIVKIAASGLSYDFAVRAEVQAIWAFEPTYNWAHNSQRQDVERAMLAEAVQANAAFFKGAAA